MVMPGWSVNLTVLFLGRLRSPQESTSTKYSYFCQLLTTVLLDLVEKEKLPYLTTKYKA